jgi:ribosomal-protein-alanine N-acetyltransferase
MNPMNEPMHLPDSTPALELLATARLRLEPLEPEHAAMLFEGLRDEQLYEFIDEGPPVSVETLRARYEGLARRRSPDGREAWLNWAVWSNPEARYIGYVQATVAADRRAFIAYVLFRDAWGYGYAAESVERVVRDLRERWGCEEVSAQVDVRNRRSIALLQRLGFERVMTGSEADALADPASGDAEYRLR